jgi:hypothetical protein
LKEAGETATWTLLEPFGRLITGRLRVDKLTFAPNGWVTTTCWAGALAEGSLLKEIT